MVFRCFKSLRIHSLPRSASAVVVFFILPGLLTSSALAQGPPKIRLANISTRLAVGTGNNVLIGGFIITGSKPKKVLIRGMGPSVPVIANLGDPVLELHNSTGALVTTADNWRDTQQDLVKATTIPPRNDYEAAMLKILNPGAYTAILAGRGNTTGVGLVEVYDLDGAVDSKLANISTRGFVSKGDNVLIGGTIIVGSGTTSVLFRGIGPSLQGVLTLKNPTLELYNGQGALIAMNDNWQDTQAAEIIATTIPPTDARESAILRQLSPGAYTAVLRGKDNGFGVAVVEAYQIN